MGDIQYILQDKVSKIVAEKGGIELSPKDVIVNDTKPEFEGEYTVVIFPFVKRLGIAPAELGKEIGDKLVSDLDAVTGFNVVKGFLNLSISSDYWINFVSKIDDKFGLHPRTGKKYLVEFASPNTNKPLHLGHVRNILLGWSAAKILDCAGHDVLKVQIVNDRGIAICKSMWAWKEHGENQTPESTGIKGDHYVGDFYVKFDQLLKQEYKSWLNTEEALELKENSKDPDAFAKSYKNKYFNDKSEIGVQTRDMLLKWESNDQEVRSLWQKMNQWVYDGFEKTYKKLGVNFDHIYYESETYLKGKDLVEAHLDKGLFYRKEDNSIWANLEDAGLDQKILLRSDGTSVYMTQDIGTAMIRNEDHAPDGMVYVVADEQNYHFKALFEILKLMKAPYADGLYHLSYGMMELPDGKMKSREGTVVDADDLIKEVVAEAAKGTEERGDIAAMSSEQKEETIFKIGLAALKYFIVRVNPQKKMIFDPKESVDLQGQTGPYIQYSYVRINGLIHRAHQEEIDFNTAEKGQNLSEQESGLAHMLHAFPALTKQAAEKFDPSLIANYCYQLAKQYHRFWHDIPIFNAEPAARNFRILLSQKVGVVLKRAMGLLGIEMPEKM